MRQASSWGSLPRFYNEAPSKEVRPGPGQYDLSQYSLFSSTYDENDWRKPLQVKRKKRRAMHRKEHIWQANSLDMLSKSGGRNSRDSWARDLPTDNPGPGRYEVIIPGTFENLKESFPPNKAVDRGYVLLKAVTKRLSKIEKLKKKEKEETLTKYQKILHKKEIHESNIARLFAKKEELERLIQQKEEKWKRKCNLIRSASAFAEIVSSPGTRGWFRQERGKAKTAEIPRRQGINRAEDKRKGLSNEFVQEFPGVDMHGLLSLSESELPLFPQDVPDIQNTSRTYSSKGALFQKQGLISKPSNHEREQKHAPAGRTDASDSENLKPCIEMIPHRNLRVPTFWPNMFENRNVTKL